MGYTHYWYRKTAALDAEKFARFSEDCAKVCKAAEIPLASWNGSGEPEFTAELVSFNGREDCGHRERDLGIAWPGQNAQGVNPNAETTGTWFAGLSLASRSCGGDCSHETFRVPLIQERADYQVADEDIFSCCKTAYKPYDICVTACLIIAKHYFGEQVRVSSDGESRDWEDGRRLCQSVLGYGADFELKDE